MRVQNGEKGGPPAQADQDSLGDAYVADGQNEKAIQASQKALELLPGDKGIPEPFKKLVQQSAEGEAAEAEGGGRGIGQELAGIRQLQQNKLS